jgi:hypothetical protein
MLHTSLRLKIATEVGVICFKFGSFPTRRGFENWVGLRYRHISTHVNLARAPSIDEVHVWGD